MRDQAVFLAIKAILDNTGMFDSVLLHQGPDRLRVAADQDPVATIRRISASEAGLSSEPITRLRTVDYEITIAVRGDAAEERFDALDLLQSITASAIDGHSLASLTLPHMTSLSLGVDDPKALHPEQRVTLKGQFAYLLEGDAGLDKIP